MNQKLPRLRADVNLMPSLNAEQLGLLPRDPFRYSGKVLYTFLRSLEPVPSLKGLKGELRHYEQGNIDEVSVVSFAAIHFGTEELPCGKTEN